MIFKAQPNNLLERIALLFNLAPIPLIDTQVAFNAARTIMAGATLGIFDAIGKDKKTAEQVAEQCATNPQATTQLLNCLVGIGYLKWSNDKYSLKPSYHKWLLKESPSNLTGKLRFQISEWNWMSKLEDFVRTGKPLDLHSSLSTEEWASYQEGMRDLSINTAKELAGKLKLPAEAANMLDIGGSHGLYSIELCSKYPNLRSTILELPGAIERAQSLAKAHGGNNRVIYKAGNALTDDLGEAQYDLVMINNVVHHFTAAQNIALAKKIARALKPGGIYAIGEFIRQQKPVEGDAATATMSLYFSLTSASGTWSKEEIDSWQEGAGLKIEKPVVLMGLPGWKLAIATKS